MSLTSQTDREVRFRVRGLSVSYGDQPALRGVDLDIPCEGVTAIVGPSGCGKSTFLQTMNRLVDLAPECRIDGQITLDGEDILRPTHDLATLRRKVGMVFQKPNPFPVSIRKNLLIPLAEHRYPRDRRDALAEASLRSVGLWDEVHTRLDSPAAALSGGQQQRLCIARALVLDPEVVLFDEPCSALDPEASAVVEELIASLAGRITPVMVTHNLAQARRIAQTLAVFGYRKGAGTLIGHGPAQQMFAGSNDPAVAKYLLGADD